MKQDKTKAVAAARRMLWVLRGILMAALLLPMLAAQAQPASTTALSSSANPAAAGQNITLTATVTGSSPTGTITFKDGSATLATRMLGSGAASYAVALPAGSHSLTAVYTGNVGNAASTSSALSQSVTQASTTLALTATPSPASQGQNVTLMARVNGSYAPSGTVTFSDGATVIGTAAVTGGAATLGLNNLAQGSHSITAAYAGDANNTASSAGAVSLTINARSGMAWQYGYDAMGRVNTVVDPNGLATYYYYDSLGRAIQTQQPPNTGSSAPTVTQLGWNLADGLTSVADPRNLVTSYTPNGLGNVTTQSSPDTNTTTFTYDTNGNVLSSTDARGKQTSYTYDNLDRLTNISYPTGTATAFEYDGGPSGVAKQKGELTKMTDESGQTVYTHDALGRLTGKTVTIGTKTFTVGYGWGDSGTAMDKLTSITYPSGSRVNYSYDVYLYVEGNPVSFIDPEGMLIMSTIGGARRDTTLAEAATFGAPGNAAAAAGMATAAAGAAAGYSGVTRVAGPLLRDIITGREYKFGDDFRAAPWGNRTGHDLGRWPHYHRRGTDGQGSTIPGQGIGRHRPWETKSTDTNMCHRF